MFESAALNQRKFLRESFCAYGPITTLITAGGFAALLPPYLYKVVIQILSTPVVSPLGNKLPYLHTENLHPLPLWSFVLLGALMALVTKPQRRFWPRRVWWNLPWEFVLGVPAYAVFAWYAFLPAFSPQFAAHTLNMLRFFPVGLVACGLWSFIYWLSVQVLAGYSWAPSASAVAHHFIRYIDIPRERVFIVRADEKSYSLLIRGVLSEIEVVRLRMGILMLLDYVAELNVYGSRSTCKQNSALAEYASLAKARRDAALAKLYREKVVSGQCEGLKLPWHEKLMQHRLAGPVFIVIGIIWATAIGLLITLLGIFRPLSSSDLALFFKASQHASFSPKDETEGSTP